MIRKFDFLVIGSGVAGMSYALQVAASGKGTVGLVCKTSIEEANTSKAQGGVASVTNRIVDNFEKHIHDTMVAGDYISDPKAVQQVIERAPEGICRLVGAYTLIKKLMANLICTGKADILNLESYITPTIRAMRYNEA